MHPVLEWGIPIIAWLQGLGDGLTPLMELFTSLGTENFYLLVLPLFLWCVDVGLGIRIGLILLVSGGLNETLKMTFGLPRPYWVSDKIRALSADTSFGLPSGHAQTSLAIWGRLAAWARRGWVTVALGLIILLISLSRPYLGVHFPADTLAGWFVGGLLLAAFLGLERPVALRLRRMKTRQLILLSFGVSLLLLALGLLAWANSPARPLPGAWIEQAARAAPGSEPIAPLSPKGILTTSGTLFGLGSGAALLYAWGGFNTRGSLGQYAARYLLGLLGMLAIYLGLRAIFPSGEDLLSLALRYIRYAAVGVWVTYLAPRLFAALRLSGSQT